MRVAVQSTFDDRSAIDGSRNRIRVASKLLAEGRRADAEVHLSISMRQYPGVVEIAGMLARTLSSNGKVEESAELWWRLLQSKDSLPSAWYALAVSAIFASSRRELDGRALAVAL